MFVDVVIIAALCIALGGASIPIAFTVNNNPLIVWIGNALGSLISALVVIYIANRITSKKSKDRLSESRFTKRIVTVFEEGDGNPKVQKARVVIDRHGLRVFSLLCPLFPGVLVSTVAVYVLGLDRHLYKKWMSAGVVLVSGGYVFGYWFLFIRR